MKYINLSKILSIIFIILFFSSIVNPNIISIGTNKIEYDLLIICPKSFSKNLIPFVNHKVNIGFSTHLLVTAEAEQGHLTGYIYPA